MVVQGFQERQLDRFVVNFELDRPSPKATKKGKEKIKKNTNFISILFEIDFNLKNTFLERILFKKIISRKCSHHKIT
jgi:hypothetical protein